MPRFSGISKFSGAGAAIGGPGIYELFAVPHVLEAAPVCSIYHVSVRKIDCDLSYPRLSGGACMPQVPSLSSLFGLAANERTVSQRNCHGALPRLCSPAAIFPLAIPRRW